MNELVYKQEEKESKNLQFSHDHFIDDDIVTSLLYTIIILHYLIERLLIFATLFSLFYFLRHIYAKSPQHVYADMR